MQTIKFKPKNILLAILTLLIFLSCACAEVKTQSSSSHIAEDCRINCVTPYNQVLGTAVGDVPAYSNCSANCISFTPNKERTIYTGMKWQCVEFARRWLLNNLGVVFGDVAVASDIWDKIQFVTYVANGKQLPIESHLNGSPTVPQIGDLLIYTKEYKNTGHVAVVIEIDLKLGIIKVAEQNFLNQSWPGNYSRQIDVIFNNGKYWLLDSYLLGWKRIIKPVSATVR